MTWTSRTLAPWLLAMFVSACGGRLTSGGNSEDTQGESDGSSSSGESSSDSQGTDETDTDETEEPPDCQLAPLETFAIEELVGEETVVQEVEALDSGDVLVAGYYGLARGDATMGFALIDAPEVLSSSFLQLRRGAQAQMWATAFGELAYTADAGDTWETWTLSHDALVHRLDLDEGVELILGGDARIGRFVDGVDQWSTVDPLSGDTQNGDQNNMLMALAYRQGRLIGAEYFGRMATAPGLDGPWTALDGPLAYEPELLDLGDLGLFLWSSGDGNLYHSDDGLEWTLRGSADNSPDSYSTQLGFRAADQVMFTAGGDGLQVSCDLGTSWSTLVPDTESTVIYDISISRDGEVWAAGYNHLHRIAP